MAHRLVAKDADNSVAQQLLEGLRKRQADVQAASGGFDGMTGAGFASLSKEDQASRIE